jgi:hypothetical protein
LAGEADIVREAGAEAAAEGIPVAGVAGAVVVVATGRLQTNDLPNDDFIQSSFGNGQ